MLVLNDGFRLLATVRVRGRAEVGVSALVVDERLHGGRVSRQVGLLAQ